MQIINKSIRIINYTTNSISARETPDTFNEYVVELIEHINNNENVRDYKTKSNATEVIGSTLQLLNQKDCAEVVLEKMDGIANRLLRTEIEAQDKVGRMRINVKKGSLIQALLFDETNNSFSYLLAKVEHSDFVDDSDFSFKTGFSKDKKTIWKSCLFDLTNPDAAVFDVKVYSDTKAKFWSDSFLELDEASSDETNTVNTFKAIDETLNRNIKNISREDYAFIRNAFIAYFRNHDFIDYNTMLTDVIGSYVPAGISTEKFSEFRNKLNDLPTKKGFDHQFSPVPSAISARIRQTYKVNEGIELKITQEISDIKRTIQSIQEPDGTRYIKIKTIDDVTYNSFKS